MSNTYIWIQDPLVCNIICEYILTAKFPYLIGLDTESAQPEVYAGLSSRPPFDLLQLTFDGSLELNGLHHVDQLPQLPRCESAVTGTCSVSPFPDIDNMPSSTLLISMGNFWRSWYADSGKKRENIQIGPYSSLLTVLTRTGHATTEKKSRSNEGVVVSFSDYLLRKVPHLMRLLKDSHIVKVGCDVDGDLRDFESLIDSKLQATLDVQTLAKSLSLPKYSLNSLAERYLGRQKFNVNVTSDWSRTKLPPELMHYAAGDSILTLRVCQAMLGSLPISNDLGVKALPTSNDLDVESLPLPRSNDVGVKALPLPRSNELGVKALPLPRSNDVGVKVVSLEEEMCLSKTKKGKGEGKAKGQDDIFSTRLSPSSSVSLSTALSSHPLGTTNRSNKVSTNIKPSEVYLVYDFLSTNNLFTGKKNSLHIGKVIQVLCNTYGAWVNRYSKSERINQANRSLEIMIKDGLCVKDPILQTISLKNREKSKLGNHTSSEVIKDKKSKSTAQLLVKTYEENILKHLRGIFPRGALPEKLANVMANRYCSRYPDADRIAYWMLYYMYQTENVLLTPSGTALVL